MESRVSFLQALLEIALSTSMSQSAAFVGVRNTRNRRVSISQPRIIFLSSNLPSAACFSMLIIGFLGQASFGFVGRKMVSSASGTACLMRSLLSPLSTHAWNKSSMKLSETISLAGSSTSSLSAFAKGVVGGMMDGGKSRLKEE